MPTYAWLAIASGLLAGVYASLDNYVVTHPLSHPERTTTAYSYVILGGWLGVIITLLGGILVGNRFGFNYLDLSLGLNPMVILSGIVGGISTVLFLLASIEHNPGIVVPFSRTSLFYIVLFESIFIIKKEPSILGILGLLLIPIGAYLIVSPRRKKVAEQEKSTDHSSKSNYYLLWLMSVFIALYVLFRKEVMGTGEVDVINFRFWLALWLAIVMTLFAVGQSYLERRLVERLRFLISRFRGAFLTVFISMTIVFLSFILELEAYRRGGPAWIVASYTALDSVAAFLIAFVLNFSSREDLSTAFGDPMADLTTWGVRFVGVLLIVLAVVLISLSN